MLSRTFISKSNSRKLVRSDLYSWSRLIRPSFACHVLQRGASHVTGRESHSCLDTIKALGNGKDNGDNGGSRPSWGKVQGLWKRLSKQGHQGTASSWWNGKSVFVFSVVWRTQVAGVVHHVQESNEFNIECLALWQIFLKLQRSHCLAAACSGTFMNTFIDKHAPSTRCRNSYL